MTYFDHAHNRSESLKEIEILPPLKTSGFSGIKALRAMIPCMIAWLRLNIHTRGARGIARRVEASLNRLHKREKAAMVVIIKKALRSCPLWQARVFEDLRGEPALACWETRLLRTYAPPPEEYYSWLNDHPDDWPMIEDAVPRMRAKAQESKGPRLDRDGLFRWAVIKQAAHERRLRAPLAPRIDGGDSPETFGSFKDTSERQIFAGPWPIEVGPSDLLDTFEPDEIIELRRPAPIMWEAQIALPLQWHGEMSVIRSLMTPEMQPACLLPV